MAQTIDTLPDPVGERQDPAQRELFLEQTLATRDTAFARELLVHEWRYLGPLLADLPANGRVLDLACGTGSQARAWAERGYRALGLELDLRLLHTSRRFAEGAAPSGPPPGWLCADAVRLPCRDGSVDVVFCNSLLEHVPRWREVLTEIGRVLRRGGVAIIYTTNRSCPWQMEVRAFPFYGWLPGPVQRRVLAWIMAHRRDLVGWTELPAINWFTFGGLSRAFREAGLEPFDRLQLMEREGRGGPLIAAANRFGPLKWPYHVYARSMALYGRKR